MTENKKRGHKSTLRKDSSKTNVTRFLAHWDPKNMDAKSSGCFTSLRTWAYWSRLAVESTLFDGVGWVVIFRFPFEFHRWESVVIIQRQEIRSNPKVIPKTLASGYCRRHRSRTTKFVAVAAAVAMTQKGRRKKSWLHFLFLPSQTFRLWAKKTKFCIRTNLVIQNSDFSGSGWC